LRIKERTESQKALRTLIAAMMAGLFSVPVYALHLGGKGNFFAVTSVGCLLAGASAFVGGVLGFLFGIPRTLQQEGVAPAPEANGNAESGAGSRRIDYRANTNLEQISDWLTKILVGVGLTQLPEIRKDLTTLTAFAAQGLGAQENGKVFAFALLSYTAVLGFLFGYLWTRLFLAGALRQADQVAIGALVSEVKKATEKAETTERKIDELKKQRELDAAALNLAYRQLNPTPDLPDVTQDALEAAIAATSRPIKVQIFNQAWKARGENWRDAESKPKMERAIPLFRALIRNDPKNQFHMNHGQLGFALKDKRDPDWPGAEKELTQAIEIRGPWEEKGWVLYEFNRAFCRIMQDAAYAQGLPSPQEGRERILADLRVAANAEEVRLLIRNDPAIRKWMALNAFSESDLHRP
jgi:hypothetical protein